MTLLSIIIWVYLLSIIQLELICKKLFGLNVFDWLKTEYYEKFDWLLTRKFINILIVSNYIIAFIISPIFSQLMFGYILYVMYIKK